MRTINDLKIRHASITIGVLLITAMVCNVILVRTLAMPESLIQQSSFASELRLELAELKPSLVIDAADTSEVFLQFERALEEFRVGGRTEFHGREFELPPVHESELLALDKVVAACESYREQIERSEREHQQLNTRYDFLVQNTLYFAESVDNAIRARKQLLQNWLWGLVLFNILIFGVCYYFLRHLMLEPIFRISHTTRKLAVGNLSEKIDLSNRNEIGYIAQNINNLAAMLQKATEFTQEIGEGNLEVKYKEDETEIEEESLAGSLIQMREKMSKIAELDRQRAWAAEGLARFSDILRRKADDLDALSANLLTELVEYLGSAQGNLYILDENEKDPSLELKASWAYDREKFIEGSIKPGEGLLGQLYLEGKTLNMVDIPKGYLNIASGLGDAPPTNLIITPLKLNEETLGMLELASFKGFEDYQVEFLERLGEAIASSLYNARVNRRTQVLLNESQSRAQEIQAQEEEMRQNMEELQATQEEMQRKERDYLATIEELKGRLGE